MADIKTKRSMLNTTINEDVLNNFRDYCKVINCPMNVVLETFMDQFSKGQFRFKLAKSEIDIVE